jgi:glycosyltransferase involved in cell wall biosynthesis
MSELPTPRILVLGAHATSGVSMHRYTELLAEAWRETGAHVLLFRPPPALSSRLARRGKWLGYVEKFVFAVPRIRKLAQKSDLVHVADHSDALWVLLLPRQCRTLVTCHDLIAVRAARGELAEHRTRLSGRLYQWLVIAGLRRARALSAVSECTAQDVRRIVGRPCEVLSNPVDRRLLTKTECTPPTGWPEGREFLLVVSGTGWRKRRHESVRAWACLQETSQLRGVSLVIVGPPPDEAENSLIDSLPIGIRRQIHRYSSLHDEQLQWLYRNCRALLQLSAHEGFGWPVVEALAHGRAVLASDGPVFREIGGPDVVYIDVPQAKLMTPDAWASVAARLVSCQPNAEAIQGRYSWERFVRELDKTGCATRGARVLYLLSHPTQYQSPMLCALSAAPDLHIHVLYSRRAGLDGCLDPGFGRPVTWDVPLLDGYSHEFLPMLAGSQKPSRLTPYSRGLFNAANRFRPDAVWLHGYDHINAVRLLLWAKVHRIPVLVRAEVEDSDALGGTVVRPIKDLVLRRYFVLVDRFLAIGNRNAEFYGRRGVQSARIHRVPYAVDNSRFAKARQSVRSEETLASQFDIPDPGDATFLFSGKLIPRKRPVDTVLALQALRDLHEIDASLVVIGTGELEEELRLAIERAGLGNRVALAGFVNQTGIAELYALSDALLLTSSRERWGLVANEAMAAGCPVISYEDVGCSNDLVLDHQTGRVVPTKDVLALAAAMAQLCDPNVRERLSKAALNHVAQYSFTAVERGLREALGSIK